MRVYIGRTLIVGSILSIVLSTMSVYPNQIAYFNESAGGSINGWQHLLGSGFEWGGGWKAAVESALALRDFAKVKQVWVIAPGSQSVWIARSLYGEVLSEELADVSGKGVAILSVDACSHCSSPVWSRSQACSRFWSIYMHAIHDSNVAAYRVSPGFLLVLVNW